jgi:HlyD family secretion protein
VDAGVSDVHAKRLQSGQPVVVRIGDERLEGTVAEINPTVVNGLITVAVALGEPSSPLLRSNLRVDVEIVTARRPQTLRVRRGPFATGEGTQPVFVVRGTRAERQAVTFGISGADYFEVTEGLMAGDEVIVSDMRDYQRLERIRLE